MSLARGCSPGTRVRVFTGGTFRHLLAAVAGFCLLVTMAACSETGRASGSKEPSVVDEQIGSYNGLRFGDTSRAVRRKLGSPTGREDLMPIGGGIYDDLGLPGFGPPPGRPSTRRLLEREWVYPRSAYYTATYAGLYAISVIDPAAETTAGVGVGDALDNVRSAYHHARCGRQVIEDDPGVPFCAAQVAKHRHVWFGGDPIASITISVSRPN